jgi:serine/threonine-protein kinase
LVLELVEGPTLADRLEAGALPVDEAVHIASQIADALAAAHDAGIVHRDLKPANVKVRTDGTVKVLDFGLAKIADTGPVAAPPLPTITTPAMTAAGIILGTAAYMSPEQAKGKQVDKRADVWAFGVVLFEMLTGHRPFAGD